MTAQVTSLLPTPGTHLPEHGGTSEPQCDVPSTARCPGVFEVVATFNAAKDDFEFLGFYRRQDDARKHLDELQSAGDAHAFHTRMHIDQIKEELVRERLGKLTTQMERLMAFIEQTH